jgi:hypothetical protein
MKMSKTQMTESETATDTEYLRREIVRLTAEVARLQDAERRALAIADERSQENVALRSHIERLERLTGRIPV